MTDILSIYGFNVDLFVILTLETCENFKVTADIIAKS